MQLFKQPNIDFLKYKFIFMGISAAIILAGLLLIAKNGLKYGVDFSGGTAIHMKFRTAPSLDAIRKTLKDSGYLDSGVQGFKDATQVLVRLPQKVASDADIGNISRRVQQILLAKVMNQNVPEGKKDLNNATDFEIRQYLAVKDPWHDRNLSQSSGLSFPISENFFKCS